MLSCRYLYKINCGPKQLIDCTFKRLQIKPTNLHSTDEHLIVYSRKAYYSNKMDISNMRQPYNEQDNVFLEDNLEVKEPFDIFTEWFNEVKSKNLVKEPNAVCVATASKDGLPSARYMLLKAFDKSFGFKLFTNMGSRKGKELVENPNAALTFYWEPLSRSVRVEGKVELLPMEEVIQYHNSRPYKSQVGAYISAQSKPVANRKVLEDKAEECRMKYPEGAAAVPLPENWGGFRVIPHTIEFWQGQTGRIHDRIRFRKLKPGEKVDATTMHEGKDDWYYERLNP